MDGPIRRVRADAMRIELLHAPAARAHRADDLMALLKQKLRSIQSQKAGDTRDKHLHDDFSFLLIFWFSQNQENSDFSIAASHNTLRLSTEGRFPSKSTINQVENLQFVKHPGIFTVIRRGSSQSFFICRMLNASLHPKIDRCCVLLRYPRDDHDPVHLLVREVWREVLEWRADDAAVREALRGGLREELLGQGHHDLADGRAVGREGLCDRVMQLFVVMRADEREAVRVRDLLHVRKAQVLNTAHTRVDANAYKRLSAEEVGLRLADAVIAAVVDDENLDRQLVADDRLELLQVHLDGAVAGEDEDVMLLVHRIMLVASGPVRVTELGGEPFIGGFMEGWIRRQCRIIVVLLRVACIGIRCFPWKRGVRTTAWGRLNGGMHGHCGTDRRRESIAHRGDAVLRDEAGARLDAVGLSARHTWGAVADDGHLARGRLVGKLLDQRVDVGEGRRVLRGQRRIARREVRRQNRRVVVAVERTGREPAEAGGGRGSFLIYSGCVGRRSLRRGLRGRLIVYFRRGLRCLGVCARHSSCLGRGLGDRLSGCFGRGLRCLGICARHSSCLGRGLGSCVFCQYILAGELRVADAEGVVTEEAFAALEERVRRGVAEDVELAEQALQELTGVGVHGEVTVHGRLPKLLRIDVVHDHVGVAGPALEIVADLTDVEAGANAENQVCILYGKVARTVTAATRTADVERVVARDDVRTVPADHDRDTEAVCDFQEESLGARDANAVPRIEDRTAARADLLEDDLHLLRIHRRHGCLTLRRVGIRRDPVRRCISLGRHGCRGRHRSCRTGYCRDAGSGASDGCSGDCIGLS